LCRRFAKGDESASVLVVAAGELDVVEHDPVVGGVELGECGQAWQEVGLVDRAQHWLALHRVSYSLSSLLV
jgi:hypothetical protein